MSPGVGRWAALVVLLPLLLLGGCDTNEEGPDVPEGIAARLLQDDDLDGVEDTTVLQSVPSSGPCGSVDLAERGLFFSVPEGDTGLVEIELEGGDRVLSGYAMIGDPVGVAERVAAVEAALGDCAGLEPATYEPLTGLPDGAVGYRAVQPVDGGGVITDRVVVPAGDAVVLVGVWRDGGDAPTTDIQDLVVTAQDRASST